VAVASAGPYASLHLAPDRQPHQHPTTLLFTGRMPFLPPNQQRQSTEGKHARHTQQVIARREDMPPRRSRRIYVRARADPQSAQLWWPAVAPKPAGTDRRTDGRIAASLNPPLTAGGIIIHHTHTHCFTWTTKMVSVDQTSDACQLQHIAYRTDFCGYYTIQNGIL